MKRTGKPFKWLVFMIPVNILLTLYLLMTFYYNDTFWVGTWINEVYCTGKSVEEVNVLLREQMVYDEVQVVDLEGKTEILSLKTINYDVDYTSSLKELLDKQNPFFWLKGVFSNEGYQVQPYITYDEENLQKIIAELEVVKAAENPEPVKAEIRKTADGYELWQNFTRKPNADKVIKSLMNGINTGQKEIKLANECYEDTIPTAEMEEVYALWKQIEALQDCKITYDMTDEQVSVDAAAVAEWIAVDEDGDILTDEAGNVLLKEDCFKTFIYDLAQKYDTYNVPREFQTTRGDLVTIEKGTYGNRLDKNAEIEYLKEAFLTGKEEIHIPTYDKEALYKGKDDIGDTYIEVDMTEQVMYYYKEGELVIETPIVSGNISAGHRTP